MKSTYTEAFVEQALVKLFSRGDRTIRSVAEDRTVPIRLTHQGAHYGERDRSKW